ncbi:MAG: family serine peptidase [Firmicutes bacterium]|nr:family serine peptidase [Bacillota bacterium]
MAATSTAPDRLHWTDLQVDPALVSADGVAYGNGQFVAVKGPAESVSQDGQHWTKVDPHTLLLSIDYVNGRFVSNSTSGNGKQVLVSDDGRAWKTAAEIGLWSVGNFAYGNGRYVVAHYSFGAAVLSADLKPLAEVRSPEPGPVWGVSFGKGLFAAVGGDHIAYSADGLAWTRAITVPGDSDLFQVAYGGGRFVAAGARPTGLLYTSADGKQWTRVEPGGSQLLGVIYGGGRFLAWNQESILTSADGQHWTTEPNPAGAARFAYGGGRFVAVGEGGTQMTAVGCGARFPDVAADHPSCDAVEQLAARQILVGNPDGSFRPNAAVTRAEVAKMMVLNLGLKPDPQGRVPFADSARHWAAQSGYLQAAVSAGIINGFPDGTFQPDLPVTRGQLAKMVAAAAGLKQEPGAAYSDIRSTDWFAGWAGSARKADLIGAGGYHSLWQGAEFRGAAPATRGETAILLDNLANH